LPGEEHALAEKGKYVGPDGESWPDAEAESDRARAYDLWMAKNRRNDPNR
jgi:hypothetical protein